MSYAIVITIDPVDKDGISELIAVMEYGYKIDAATATAELITYVLSGTKPLPEDLIKRAVAL